MDELHLFDLPEPDDPYAADVQGLFDFWCETFNKNAKTQLDEAREKKLRAALKRYGFDDCKRAILGCSYSPWHQGQNPMNKKYHDLTLIFRNADKTEGFIGLYYEHTDAKTRLQEWIDS